MRNERLVLVIDDDPSIRMLLGETLVLEEYEVETAASGVEGVEKVVALEPSVVSADGDAEPTETGAAYEDIIRAIIDHGLSTFVIACTGDEQAYKQRLPRIQKMLKEAGLSPNRITLAQKPFDINGYVNLVARVVKRSLESAAEMPSNESIQDQLS